MSDDFKLLVYVVFVLLCAGIVGTLDRQAEELAAGNGGAYVQHMDEF